MAKWRHLTYDLSGGTASIRVLREKERQAIAEGINSRFDSTVAKIQKSGEIEVKNIRSWSCVCFDVLGEMGWEMVSSSCDMSTLTVFFKRPLEE